MAIQIRLHDDLRSFGELVRPILEADPVRHTIAVTVLAARLRPGAPNDLAHLVTVHEDGVVTGAAMRVEGWSLIVSALPARFAPAVADVLAGQAPEPTGVSGPRDEAEAFATAWRARTGRGCSSVMGQRLFELGTLTPPAGVPGGSRVATLADLDLLDAWYHDFAEDALPADWPRAGRDDIARMIAAGHPNVLWEVDGEPVSMATARPPAADMSRIGPVWTPPEHRNRGFGSAVTAAATQWALDAGARHVVLFTDLANPVSNSIYQRIGFRPLLDAVDMTFER